MTTASSACVGARVDALRTTPGGAAQLLALLPENLPMHAGRTPAQMGRFRGYVLAAFADLGLPDAAMPYVVESLETGDVADEVAGAAVALRGLERPPVGIVSSLLRAVDRRAGADTTVSFEAWAPRWPYTRPTTALTEVVRTLGHLGRHDPAARDALAGLAQRRRRFAADLYREIDDALEATAASHAAAEPAPSCCTHAQDRPVPESAPEEPTPADVLVEAQDGWSGGLDEYLRDRPSVVTFFYTRCDNPQKCSLTIRTLAHVGDELRERGLLGRVCVAAITYDPDFDLPHRLERYGRDRGMAFGPHARFFRVTAGFAALQRRFDLGVNYGGSTVNRHRVELHVLDAKGDVAVSVTRRHCAPKVVCDAVESLLSVPAEGGQR